MYEIAVRKEFVARHGLRNLKGIDEPIHEEHWRLDVAVTAPAVDAAGCVVDFHDVERALEKTVEPFMNRTFNDIPPFTIISPSTENIAHYFFGVLSTTLNAGNVRVRRVTVWEKEHCRASYEEESH